MSLKIVKFINGEELVGVVTEVNEDNLTIKEPLNVVVQPTGDGRAGIGLLPFMPYTKTKEFTFNISNVMTFADPIDQMQAEYTRITSGIVLASGLK